MKIRNDWSLKEIISLSFLKGLTYKRQRESVEKFKSLEDFTKNVYESNISFFGNISKQPITNSEHLEKAEEQLEFCQKNDINIITIWDENYPVLLKEISYPPTLLYVKGNLQPANSLSISVVGTRHCTSYGKLCAERFVKDFVANNIIITSGLAYGIDSVAHRACIKAEGITYAVIASGLDKMQSNAKKLADEIVNIGGAIISEYPCGTTAHPGYFPQRNRIISGISNALLVVETALKGGSLISARFAQEQNREVYAIPGAITAEKSKGCNNLIYKNGATIAISAEEIMRDLGLIVEEKYEKEIIFDSDEEKMIYDLLASEPMNADMLQEKTQIKISELLVLLLEMEFKGKIQQMPGKLYISIK